MTSVYYLFIFKYLASKFSLCCSSKSQKHSRYNHDLQIDLTTSVILLLAGLTNKLLWEEVFLPTEEKLMLRETKGILRNDEAYLIIMAKKYG